MEKVLVAVGFTLLGVGGGIAVLHLAAWALHRFTPFFDRLNIEIVEDKNDRQA